MLTRSQSRTYSIEPILSTKKCYENTTFDIDFDGASVAWNANKKRIGQMYFYICGHPVRQGTSKCQRASLSTCIDGYCKQHSKV